MHYFIRKSFHQNQSESKDHYFLPDEDEKDNVELKESDQSISVDEPHEQILIKNFASNARVNIDIVYEDNKNIQKAQNKTSKANENQYKKHQSIQKRTKLVQQNKNANLDMVDGQQQLGPTPIKNPKYSYEHSYDKTSSNTAQPVQKFIYPHSHSKQNKLYQDRRNQRYFNTKIGYPLSPTKKIPKQNFDETQHNQANSNTPFPSSKDKLYINSGLNIGRISLSNRFNDRQQINERKEKKFYNVSQQTLEDKINKDQIGKDQKRFFEQDGSDSKYQKFKNDEEKRTFRNGQLFVREEISEEFIGQKVAESQQKEGLQLEDEIRSSEQIESQIGQQIQHQVGFFLKVDSKPQIEQLILPHYVNQINRHSSQRQTTMNHRGQSGNSQGRGEIEQEQNKSLKQTHSRQEEIAIYHSNQQTQTVNQHPIQVDQSNIEQEIIHTHHTQQSTFFPALNHVPPQYHVTLYDQPIQTQNQSSQVNSNQSKPMLQHIAQGIELRTPAKWRRNKSTKQFDLKQYQTRPKTDEIIQIDHQQKSIEYSIHGSTNKMTQSRHCWNQQFQEEKQCTQSEKQEHQTPNQQADSHASIQKLSSIENLSPNKAQSPGFHKTTPQQYQNALQQYIHSRYNIQIESTQQKQPSSLKYESVVSFSISPSPKNNRFTVDSQILGDNQYQSGSAQLSLTSSIQKQRSLSRQTPRTYQDLQKYKRLFKKNNTKNPQSPIDNKTVQSCDKNNFINLNQTQQSYYQNTAYRNSNYIKSNYLQAKPHHHQSHCFNQTQPPNFKFKNYSSKYQLEQSDRPSHSRGNSVSKILDFSLSDQSKTQNKQGWIQPNIVKVNLKDKIAQDLFMKHKNDFLNKLKHKQKNSNSYLNEYSTSGNKQKQIQTKLNLNNQQARYSSRSRPLSPYIQNLTKRLSSPSTHSPICQHYKKYSKRDMRNRFLDLLQREDCSFFKKYYLSQDELNQLFVEEILNKEINEIYWVEVVKAWGERKLQNMKLRSKSKYHPHEKKVIKQQQILADTKRTYINNTSRAKNSLSLKLHNFS